MMTIAPLNLPSSMAVLGSTGLTHRTKDIVSESSCTLLQPSPRQLISSPRSPIKLSPRIHFPETISPRRIEEPVAAKAATVSHQSVTTVEPQLPCTPTTTTTAQVEHPEAQWAQFYDLYEETLNFYTHAGGALFYLIVAAINVYNMCTTRSPYYFSMANVGYLFYTLSLLFVFTASALYHYPHFSIENKLRFRTLDYAAIFVLNAATFTPACITIFYESNYVQMVHTLCWLVTMVFIVRTCTTSQAERDNDISTIQWLYPSFAVMISKYLVTMMDVRALLLYIVGFAVMLFAGIYLLVDRVIKNAHVYWHCASLTGTFLHFLAVYLYIAQ